MYQPLNEGKLSLDTVFSMAAGAVNAATAAKKSGNNDVYSSSSIAKEASKLVAVFPVLASRTVSAKTAQLVTKYIEQKACTLFMLALQSANINTAKSGVEYLRTFHQNLDLGGDNINAIISIMNNWIDAYNTGKVTANESATIEEEKDESYYSDMLESDRDLVISSRDMKELLEVMKENENIKFYDTKLNPISINDYVVREFENGTYHVSLSNIESLREAKGGSGRGVRAPYRNGRYANRQDALNAQNDNDADEEKAYQDKKRRWEEEDRRLSQARDYVTQRERQEDREERREDREEQKRDRAQQRAEHAEDRAEQKRDREEQRMDRAQQREEHKADREEVLRQRQLARDEEEALAASRKFSSVSVGFKDQDIKKMNNAVPSILVVKFYNSSNASVGTEFIIGVKSKLIPVTTTEVLRRIMNDNKDGKSFLKFMKFMTGELKVKEFLFGISRLKDDTMSAKSKGAYGNVWNLLSNRAEAARYAVKHGKHNDFSAITTVLISQNDVDELFREENFDISSPSNALHFMQSYNLMGFIIADDATETLKIMMDDGEKMFSEYAYSMLERENKDGETYKKLINLMAASK